MQWVLVSANFFDRLYITLIFYMFVFYMYKECKLQVDCVLEFINLRELTLD